MRTCLSLVMITLLSFSGASYAQTVSDTSRIEDRQAGWNQWICKAYARGNLRPFYGRSQRFRQGSGEGREARRQAHLSALRRCEVRTGQQCRSRIQTDCEVRRL